MNINILFIGDVVGKPGMDMLTMWLPGLIRKYNADFVIANGENASDGKGCTEKEGKQLLGMGIHTITGGNHSWEKHQSQAYLKEEPRSLRPLNYPKGTFGNGYYIGESKKGKVGVINLQGRSFMQPIDCPFRAAEVAINKIRQETKVIFIDFHAEATAEKLALAYFLDGKVSVVAGTHTHIQTADARILSGGTAYITDTGMTGPYDSVIGMKTDAAVNRFLYQTPQKYETASEGSHLCGIFVSVDQNTGKANSIEPILIPEFETKK